MHDPTIILVYVDDIVLTVSNSSLITKLKSLLHATFSIKDLGPIKYYLGLEFSRTLARIFVHKCKYALDLLEKFSFSDSKPFSIHMEQHLKLHDSHAPFLNDITAYWCLIGKLQYMTMT